VCRSAGREVAYGQPVFVIRGLDGASRAARRQQQQQQQVKRDSSWPPEPANTATAFVTRTTAPSRHHILKAISDTAGQRYYRRNVTTETGFSAGKTAIDD